LPPFRFKKDYIDKLKKGLPELPAEKFERFQSEFKLTPYDSEILTRERVLADYFEQTVRIGESKKITAKQIANEIINKKININEVLPETLADRIHSKSQTVTINEAELKEIVIKVISENQKAVFDYKSGKFQVMGFLIGIVRKTLGKPIDPNFVENLVKKEIEKK